MRSEQHDILFVFSRAPHSGSLANDCLDAAMTAMLLNQSVGILFVADGVYQLAESAWAASILSLGELAPLELCVVKQDLDRRGIKPESLAADTRQLDDTELSALFDQYDRVLSF